MTRRGDSWIAGYLRTSPICGVVVGGESPCDHPDGGSWTPEDGGVKTEMDALPTRSYPNMVKMIDPVSFQPLHYRILTYEGSGEGMPTGKESWPDNRLTGDRSHEARNPVRSEALGGYR